MGLNRLGCVKQRQFAATLIADLPPCVFHRRLSALSQPLEGSLAVLISAPGMVISPPCFLSAWNSYVLLLQGFSGSGCADRFCLLGFNF